MPFTKNIQSKACIQQNHTKPGSDGLVEIPHLKNMIQLWTWVQLAIQKYDSKIIQYGSTLKKYDSTREKKRQSFSNLQGPEPGPKLPVNLSPWLAKGAAVPKPKPIPTVKAVVTKKAKAADWRMVTPWSRPMVDGHRGLETNGWTAEVWHIEGCSFFGSFSPRWRKFKHGKFEKIGSWVFCCI